MATIASAKAKYQAKQSQMAANYAEGMGNFLGMNVSGSAAVRSYQTKMSDPYTADRWEQGLRNAFSF